MSPLRKVKIYNTKSAMDFHKGHKDLNYIVLSLSALCIFCELCGQK